MRAGSLSKAMGRVKKKTSLQILFAACKTVHFLRCESSRLEILLLRPEKWEGTRGPWNASNQATPVLPSIERRCLFA
jgi:hypothetical protein